MEWGHSETDRGVTERDFSVSRHGRTVPGVLWSPENAAAPTPLVLIGHGGSGDKRETHLVALARRFVRHNGIAAATIDGPAHGDRKPKGADDESLHANPGLHSAVPREEFLYTQTFLAHHLELESR